MSANEQRQPASVRALMIAALVVLLGGVLGLMIWQDRNNPEGATSEASGEPEPDAPPELEKHAATFREGVEAVEQGFGPRGVELLSSFSFGSRPVEQYRLYYLANAHQLTGAVDEARRTLAGLFKTNPTMALSPDVAFHLGDLYEGAGSHRTAASTFGSLATHAKEPAIAGAARDRYLDARFRTADVGAILLAATNQVVENPGEAQAEKAAAILRSLRGQPGKSPLPLTPLQRLRRTEALLAANRPKAALDELQSIDAAALPRSREPHFRLAKGEALQRTGQHKASEEVIGGLFSSYYDHAIPALRISVANQRNLADSIRVMESKTVKQKVRSGTRLVKRKGKRVRVPNYKTVTKTVQLKNLAKEAEKKKHEATYRERLRDLLTLPIDDELERDVLSRLVVVELGEKDDAALRRYLPRLVQLDPSNDTALQRFWDVGWTNYTNGNFEQASHSFQFIASTYRNPNIRRQATYWHARSLERRGEAEKARAIYTDLAKAPYRDLYALFATARLGDRAPAAREALPPRVSWDDVADEKIPDELRLAYELNAVGLRQQARLEVQRNASFDNRKWADSILGELYFYEGAHDLSYRFLRRAWPELATPEQNAVPWRFVQMYYPLRFEEEIREGARKNDLDPYLVMALIRQESAFNPNARSHVGATGLMQIMPATGKELGTRIYGRFQQARLADPEVNVALGTHYLARVIRLFDGNVELALAGYNGGPYRILRWRKEQRGKPLDEFIEGIPLAESRGYVKRITLIRSTYEELYGSGRDGEREARTAGNPGNGRG
jgi:soluble lytic murein transglycosylase-like protein